MQKKVLALHDLSGFGRSSLVPIIAAISAAGHQCVPLPTAYFSTHMAIPGWETVDLTGVMPCVIDQYDRLGLRFESVYAGFLGSADQIDCVRDAVLRLKSENGTAFIDPVMGDNGEVYATYTPEMCTRMRELCEIADIITPNTTEAAILLDRDPASAPQNETEAQEWLHALHSRYGAQVVLTGLDYEPGKVGSGCLSADGGTISLHERIAQYYPGTGDLFAAVVHHIIGQQISMKAQATIWQRMRDALGTVDAEHLLAAGVPQLQQLGMTFRKAEYITDFAEKIRSGAFNLGSVKHMSDADAIRALSSLKGIGVWTAEMILLFCLQRPNVFSYDDLAIQRGLRMVYHHRKIDRKLFEKYHRRFSPYCSVASLYLWEVSGGAIPGMRDYALVNK